MKQASWPPRSSTSVPAFWRRNWVWFGLFWSDRNKNPPRPVHGWSEPESLDIIWKEGLAVAVEVEKGEEEEEEEDELPGPRCFTSIHQELQFLYIPPSALICWHSTPLLLLLLPPLLPRADFSFPPSLPRPLQKHISTQPHAVPPLLRSDSDPSHCSSNAWALPYQTPATSLYCLGFAIPDTHPS